jgi:hypothetical protein
MLKNVNAGTNKASCPASLRKPPAGAGNLPARPDSYREAGAYALARMGYALLKMPYALTRMGYALTKMPYALVQIAYAKVKMCHAVSQMAYAKVKICHAVS